MATYPSPPPLSEANWPRVAAALDHYEMTLGTLNGGALLPAELRQWARIMADPGTPEQIAEAKRRKAVRAARNRRYRARQRGVDVPYAPTGRPRKVSLRRRIATRICHPERLMVTLCVSCPWVRDAPAVVEGDRPLIAPGQGVQNLGEPHAKQDQ